MSSPTAFLIPAGGMLSRRGPAHRQWGNDVTWQIVIGLSKRQRVSGSDHSANIFDPSDNDAPMETYRGHS